MMTNIDDGGPAFPACNEANNNGTMGMTLRDWFAGQALRARWGSGDPMTPSDAAFVAYEFADAMLAARKDRTDD